MPERSSRSNVMLPTPSSAEKGSKRGVLVDTNEVPQALVLTGMAAKIKGNSSAS